MTADTVYLERLTDRLASGLSAVPPDQRSRHADWITHLQNEDGGFSGREGASDIYYTSFALRSLACLEALDGTVVRRVTKFLRSRLDEHADIVELVSLLSAAWFVTRSSGEDFFAASAPNWQSSLDRVLASFRTPDGGYAKAAGCASGSTYHTFLVALAYEIIGLELPDREGVAAFVRSRRRDDGGFVEVAPMRRSGTNPTAAAVAVLLALDACDDATRTGAIDFLTGMRTAEGGLRANSRIPLADLLSTFTGLVTLVDLGAGPKIDWPAARRYAEALEAADGGFRGGLWDDRCDVEYTFYGLGTLALANLAKQ